jgi:ABC-type Mn2+/Zn2+ transport system ATPase subunit
VSEEVEQTMMTWGSWWHRLARPMMQGEPGWWLLLACVLRVAERLLLALAALALIEQGSVWALAWTVVMLGTGALFGMVQAQLQRCLRVRLTMHVAYLVLQPRVLLSGDAQPMKTQALMFEGLAANEALLASSTPEILADLAVLPVLLVWLIPRQSLNVLIVLFASFVIAGVIAWVLRTLVSKASRDGWEKYNPVVDQLQTVVLGGLEVVAMGLAGVVRQRLRLAVQLWADALFYADRMAEWTGRLPLASAGVLVLISLPFQSHTLAITELKFWKNAVLLFSLLPPITALGRSFLRGSEAWGRLHSWAPWLEPQAVPQPGATPTRAQLAQRLGSDPPELNEIVWDCIDFGYEPETLILNNLQVRWRRGELMTVSGPNGAGKSTLFRLLLGLCIPQQGAIFVDGQPLDSEKIATKISYLPQRPYLNEQASIRDTMAMLTPEASEEIMQQLLERMGVWGHLRSREPKDPLAVLIGELSMGQRQRVAIARVFARPAEIWLLDEPDASLDSEGVDQLRMLIDETKQNGWVGVVVHGDTLCPFADKRLELGAVFAKGNKRNELAVNESEDPATNTSQGNGSRLG